MGGLERFCQFLNRALILVAGFSLVAMVSLTCADIFSRLIWVPITGCVELVSFFGAIVAAFALGYTQMRRGHIWVDVLINLFPDGIKRLLNMINSLVCMAFFAIVAWRIARWSTTIWATGEVTETLHIIYYPFSYGVALGCGVLSIVFLNDFFKSLFPKKEGEK
jgi:TRAP-type C4-dicarboxylate transport system permease small subunit